MSNTWAGLSPDDDLVVMAKQTMVEFTDPSQRAVLLPELERQESWANADFANRFGVADFQALDAEEIVE
jgi:hypothetical protein